jgi:peptide/nickel transport system permease protein
VRDRRALILGCVLLAVFAIVAVIAPLIEPYNPRAQVGAVFGSPSGTHLLGLDDGGVDMLSLVIAGTRTSLLVGVAATAISVVIGSVVGICAGYFGGRVDGVLMRITDISLVVPVLPLMIVVAAIWGPSLAHAILIIGLLSWTAMARVMRAQVLSVRERAFVRRVKTMGASDWRIIWHHVLPQVRSLLLANAVIVIAAAIFFEASLAFLGLESADTISWGTLIANAFNRAASSVGAWWAFVPPGACIALFVLACSLVAMALEDADNTRILSPHIFSGPLRVVFRDAR